ncbi:MAG: acetyl-CoA C-acyltransferase [Luteimonas sp.]|nr:acetyl-CoA C-acyltransferase [Luteimonas sp.]
MTREVVVLSGVRTAIGGYGGSLKDVPPCELGAICVREAVRRAGVKPADVGHVVFGNVIHTRPEDMYMARVVGMNAGIPKETPAYTVNRLCGTGVQAIVSAAQAVQTGEARVALAGGAESMSRGPYWIPNARWGARMGEAKMVDPVMGGLTDPFSSVLMGVTAENLAERMSISREDQDAFALASHQKALAAQKAGEFKDEITPYEVVSHQPDLGGNTIRLKKLLVEQDEGPRPDTSAEGLAKLRPVFRNGQFGGTVTAGNSSQMSDGAGAVLLASGQAVKDYGLTPLARFVSFSVAGVRPEVMGIGPIAAIPKALKQAGLSKDQLDWIELNEAFAAQALAVIQDSELDPAKVNPLGGAIALGHPLGATGAIRTATLIHGLRRRKQKYGMVTMCIGTGMGAAGIFEAL